jgi:hypothetical protein
MKISDIVISEQVAALIKHRLVTGRQICQIMADEDPRHMSLYHRASNRMPLYTEEEVERLINSDDFKNLSELVTKIQEITTKELK